MGHYDNCREGYCGVCGAAPGNLRKDGSCPFCDPEPRAKARSIVNSLAKPRPYPYNTKEGPMSVQKISKKEVWEVNGKTFSTLEEAEVYLKDLEFIEWCDKELCSLHDSDLKLILETWKVERRE